MSSACLFGDRHCDGAGAGGGLVEWFDPTPITMGMQMKNLNKYKCLAIIGKILPGLQGMADAVHGIWPR